MQEPFLEGVPQDIPRLGNKMYTWVIIKWTWLQKVQLNCATAKLIWETKNNLRGQGSEMVQTKKVHVHVYRAENKCRVMFLFVLGIICTLQSAVG